MYPLPMVARIYPVTKANEILASLKIMLNCDLAKLVNITL